MGPEPARTVLVILPNWLGDLVMSAGFLARLSSAARPSRVDVAVPEHLADLASLLPGVTRVHAWRRQDYRGLSGAFRLGRQLRQSGPFATCYCLPRSFRSAVTAFASGAGERVGYRQELRSFLLTHAPRRPEGVHRVVEYGLLAPTASGAPSLETRVRVATPGGSPFAELGLSPERPVVALNIHSEAQARRMSLGRWARVVGALSAGPARSIVLLGSPREVDRTKELQSLVPSVPRMHDLSGRTSSGQLAGVLAACDVLLSSDSGPAHLANALGVPTVVLFGAGDERMTAPFNREGRHVVRLPGLECAPCVANQCRLGVPRCLEELDDRVIVNAVTAALGPLA